MRKPAIDKTIDALKIINLSGNLEVTKNLGTVIDFINNIEEYCEEIEKEKEKTKKALKKMCELMQDIEKDGCWYCPLGDTHKCIDPDEIGSAHCRKEKWEEWSMKDE